MTLLSHQIPEEFASIRPYAPDELPAVMDALFQDEAFVHILHKVMPEYPTDMLHHTLASCHSKVEVQRAAIFPFVMKVAKECTDGLTLCLPQDFDKQTPHTFITNHRDIVLDSAFLSALMLQNDFPTTVDIAIGDNLLIYPWIEKVVRLSSFIVQRSLSMREMLRASQTMSRYMHFAISQKEENIWIAQREGRAKDSDDRTQDSILKMMAMGGEGTIIQRLKALNIVPTALSYEYDPCDYLKAQEFQQKRDNPDFRKSKADDLANMAGGIMGYKGRVHFQASACINPWLDTLDASMPKTELFPLIAQHIDGQIHRGYRLYPINYVAADMLQQSSSRQAHYTADESAHVRQYLEQRIGMVQLEHPDHDFLLERLLTMYANPTFNQERA